MSTPDSFLVAWWLLAIILFVSGFLLVKRQRALNRQAAASIALKGGWTGRYAPPMPEVALPGMLGIGASVLILGWLVGFMALMWMSDWTRLLLLNFQLFMLLFGATCLGVGLSSSASAMVASHRMLLPRSARRPLMILLGLLASIVGLYWVVGDLAFPKLIAEGRIDSLSHSHSVLMRNEFSIVIDGKRYDTLRDVFLTVGVGDRVRAEVGAGSKTVLRAEQIGSRAQ